MVCPLPPPSPLPCSTTKDGRWDRLRQDSRSGRPAHDVGLFELGRSWGPDVHFDGHPDPWPNEARAQIPGLPAVTAVRYAWATRRLLTHSSLPFAGPSKQRRAAGACDHGARQPHHRRHRLLTGTARNRVLSYASCASWRGADRRAQQSAVRPCQLTTITMRPEVANWAVSATQAQKVVGGVKGSSSCQYSSPCR